MPVQDKPVQKQKIYLETTLFNLYFDVDREHHYDAVRLFEEIAAGKYEAFTSLGAINEINEARAEKRNKMIALVDRYDIRILALNDEAERLAQAYVEQGIIPSKYRTDGVHIAVATVNDLDILISMDLGHIVRQKTKIGARNINTLNGYRSVEICTPMEVLAMESPSIHEDQQNR